MGLRKRVALIVLLTTLLGLMLIVGVWVFMGEEEPSSSYTPDAVEAPKAKQPGHSAAQLAQTLLSSPARELTEDERLVAKGKAILDRELRCDAPGVPKGTRGRVVHWPDDLGVRVWTGGELLVINAVRNTHALKGTLELEGYKPVEITWEVFEDGSSACHIPPLEPAEGPYGLYGLVVDTQGQVVEAARISGCGGRRVDSDDEGFFIERSSMSACILDIQGPDSALQVPIPAGPGDRDLGELVLPEQNVAMGINLMRTLANPGLDAELGGWRIDYVTPGSPADQAGLKEGDLIVQAQGQEVVGVPPAKLLRVQAGERVELTLEDGRTVQVDVESTESLHLKGGYSAEDAAEYSVGWGPGFEF